MSDQPPDPEVAEAILQSRQQGLALLHETANALVRGQLRAFVLVGIDDRGRAVGTIMSSDSDMQTLSDGLVAQSTVLLKISSNWADNAPENNRSDNMN